MASPGLESFCCVFNDSHAHPISVIVSEDGVLIYNALCIISSAVSTLGASYQLYPKPPRTQPRGKREADSFHRQNMIICWLAFADLLASIGILVRSSLWLGGRIPLVDVQGDGKADFAHIFCAVSGGWIQYFYVCTYFWTFCYAWDTHRIAHDRPSLTCVYHALSWVFSAVICGAGLITLYHQSLLQCTRDMAHLLPHYLSTYIPILFIMIVNPVLYYKVSKAVRLSLMQRGRYTDQERRIVWAVNEKFLLIILVFYLCWTPNILNGVLLVFKKRVPDSVFLGLWQFMAVVNPVQAFLNSLINRGVGGCPSASPCLKSSASRNQRNHIQASTNDSTERSPLLSFRR